VARFRLAVSLKTISLQRQELLFHCRVRNDFLLEISTEFLDDIFSGIAVGTVLEG
jgi:hypothetical protein